MACRKTLVVLALLLLLAGCDAEPPADGRAGPAGPSATAAPPAPAGGDESGTGAGAPPAGEPPPRGERAAACSAAAVAADLPAQPELPPAVAATRRAIFVAATGCDFAALDELAPSGLSYSFGAEGDAVGHWREAEARGEPVLRRMAEVLRAAPAEEDGLWVWPAFFLRPVAEWSAADRRQAERLLGEELDFLTGSGAYLGYRLGIAADGTWQYFVAGD